MTKEEILILCKYNPEAIVEIILNFQKQIEELKSEIKELKEQLAKDSHNSNKPSSTDNFFKKKTNTKSLRKSSNNKTGGQKNHKGHNLKMVENPNKTIIHKVCNCKHCGELLNQERIVKVEKCQVFDIAPIEVIVTEHQSEIKICSKCGKINKANFPEEVRNVVQYGERIKTLISYFSVYQLIPLKRLKEIFRDVFNCKISEGTIVNTNNYISNRLSSVEEEIKKELIKSPVVNFDETGFRAEKKLNWVHLASTEDLTYYYSHNRRGKEAMDEMGILPFYKGIAEHDHWKAYFNYSCNHALCNVHHLRELTFIFEEYNQDWAKEMLDLLLEINEEVEKVKLKGKTRLNHKTIKNFENRYMEKIKEGFNKNPPCDKNIEIKRGRKKKSKPLNLLERLSDFRKETLGFLHNFKIPFGNNLAERDIRMIKVKLKISGNVRSKQGANTFCRIRSYISTAGKRGLNILNAISSALNNKPMIIFNKV
jgi:transposase